MRFFNCLILATTLSVDAYDARAQPVDVKKWLERYDSLDGWCRGGSEGTVTDKACELRTSAATELDRLNWCYGRAGEAGYQQRWHPCGPNSNREKQSGARPLTATHNRLPFADGTYVTDSALCRLSAQQITDRYGDLTGTKVRQINGGRLINGYELFCDIKAVNVQSNQVKFRAECDSEGEKSPVNGSWTAINEKTFRIGRNIYSACGRSIWPKE